nr:flagellin [Paraburkholderia sp. J63]
MLGINSNINSLVAQQNLTSSGSALSQAITRLSSGKRINSAADDAAGLAISNIMQTQINGLNQGVSNANNGVSMVQTASSGLASLTSSLQTIRQLATQASDGSMTDTDRQALQQEVAQQIQEVNRIASQTTYNGMNVLNGSMGNVSFQVGANVGQTISLNLSQNMSAASLGGGIPQAGNTLGSFTNLALNADGSTFAAGTSPTQVIDASMNVTNAANSKTPNGATSVSATITGSTVSYTDNKGNVYTNTAAAGATPAWNVSVGGGPATALDATDDAGTIAALNAAASSVVNVTTYSQASNTQAVTVADNGVDSVGDTAATSVTVNMSATGAISATDSDGNTYTQDATTKAWSVSINGATAVALNTTTTGDAGTIAALNAALTGAQTAGTTTTPTVVNQAAITQINVESDGNGGFTFTDQNNQAVSAQVAAKAGIAVTAGAKNADGSYQPSTITSTVVDATGASEASVGTQINSLNTVSKVSNIDISTAQGASMAMESIDNALNTVDNLQATLGAAQNRFTAITTTQQAQSTDLSSAQSSIQDADFAQETANLSKAQVLQQAGISVLAQANSQPQQILKLLQ